MNPQTLQMPVLLIIILALTSLIVPTVPSIALSALSNRTAAGSSDSSAGAACDLPPTLEIDDTGDSHRESGSPLLDKRAPKKYSTATFAMG